MVEQTMNGYLMAFDSVSVTDEGLKAEIEAFKNELKEIGGQSSDVMDFMNKCTAAGITEKQTDLLTRVHTPPAQSEEPAAETQSGGQNLPTVEQFLSQYNASYEAAKAHGFQHTAVNAYEEMFGVSERTDDLLEMNIILEKENLFFKPAGAAFYDINKLTYDSQDPNFEAGKQQFERLMNLGLECKTQEELDYKNDKAITENQQNTYRFTWERMVYPTTLSKYLLDYLMLKINIWADNNVEQMVPGFVYLREGIKRFYPKAKELTGLDLEDLVANPYSRRFLFAPENVDALGLSYLALDDKVIDLWREQLDEILSDSTESEILAKVPENPMYWGLDKRMPDQDAAFKQMQARSEQVLSDRYYYDYFKKVGVPDLENMTV